MAGPDAAEAEADGAAVPAGPGGVSAAQPEIAHHARPTATKIRKRM